ncbi:lycopene cyclase domain-containing protein [Pedobacter sp. Du54]|uniref:lycopene cyclase domain-containing protein n=1 Tax=Pedobacter anseongensis TaxID=3133439 RepID=UPI003097CE3E
MTHIFLYLNVFLVLIPIALATDKKVFVKDNIRSVIIPSLIVTVIFSETGVFFAGLKVWTFNPVYLLGITYRQLPLEMYLFYFTSSFAGLGIYNYLNAKFPKNDLQKYSLSLSHLLLGIMVAILFFAYTKWYTATTFVLLFLLMLYIEYKNQLRFMYRFYRAFIVCLIPFYISYGILCNVPIISYNAAETIDVNFLNIPFENYFYMMGMLLLGVYFMEVFKSRRAK